MLGFRAIAVTAYVIERKELGLITNEPVLLVFHEVLRRVHDLVDRADFGTFGVVQPFTSELRRN